MNTYIERQREQGQFDSEGGFTLDALAALRITLASSLPEPHYYLFLLLQGLLAGGASSIEIAIGRHSTRVRFHDERHQFVDLEKLRQRLWQGLSLSSPNPADLVLAGMATSVGQEMDRADLLGPNPQGGSALSLQLSLRHAQLVEHPGGRPSEFSTLYLHRNVSQSQSFAWTRVWGGRREEGEILRRFAHVSPPIKVAGLPTSPEPLWPAGLDPVGELGPIVLLEGAVLAEPDQPSHRVHSTHPMFPALDERGEEISVELNARLSQGDLSEACHPAPPRCLFRRAYSSRGKLLCGELAPQAWQRRRWSIFFTSQRQTKATLTWIRYGMTLEQQTVDLGWPGLYIVAPADGLDLDASGFALVHNAKLEERLEEAKGLTKRVLASVTRVELNQLMDRLGQPHQTPRIAQVFPWFGSSEV